jgi:hypothetical protein
MAGHLRSVPAGPSGPTYVIGRTRLTDPGSPYVMAQCEDPDLAEALRRWEAHDHGTHERERSARALVRSVPSGQRRSAHPSVLAKLLP